MGHVGEKWTCISAGGGGGGGVSALPFKKRISLKPISGTTLGEHIKPMVSDSCCHPGTPPDSPLSVGGQGRLYGGGRGAGLAS